MKQPTPKPETLTTQGAVARSLGVTARDMRRWREKYSDAPRKVDGKEPLEAWRAFYEAHRIELGSESEESKSIAEELKLNGIRLDNLAKERRIREYDTKDQIMRGKWIPREEVESQLAPLVAELIAKIKDRDIETSNFAPGRSTGELRAHLTETRDRLFTEIREGVGEFIDHAQDAGQKTMATEPTTINAPGAGRPKEAGSRRSKQAVKKAAKKTTKRKK